MKNVAIVTGILILIGFFIYLDIDVAKQSLSVLPDSPPKALKVKSMTIQSKPMWHKKQELDAQGNPTGIRFKRIPMSVSSEIANDNQLLLVLSSGDTLYFLGDSTATLQTSLP